MTGTINSDTYKVIVKNFYGMTRFVLRQHRGPAPER